MHVGNKRVRFTFVLTGCENTLCGLMTLELSLLRTDEVIQ